MGPIKRRLQDKLVSLIEEHFPKGNKERGRATLMMSLFYASVTEEMAQFYEDLQKIWKNTTEDTL